MVLRHPRETQVDMAPVRHVWESGKAPFASVKRARDVPRCVSARRRRDVRGSSLYFERFVRLHDPRVLCFHSMRI